MVVKNGNQWNEIGGASTHKILIYGTDFALKSFSRLIEDKVSLYGHLKNDLFEGIVLYPSRYISDEFFFVLNARRFSSYVMLSEKISAGISAGRKL